MTTWGLLWNCIQLIKKSEPNSNYTVLQTVNEFTASVVDLLKWYLVRVQLLHKHKSSLYPVSDCKRLDKCHMWLAKKKKIFFLNGKNRIILLNWFTHEMYEHAAGGDSLWTVPIWGKICLKFIYKIRFCASTKHKPLFFGNRMEFWGQHSHLFFPTWKYIYEHR